MDVNKKSISPKILAVDDNQLFLQEMKKTLSDVYSVVTATSASAAMALMTTDSFDLILLDFEMPDMTGLEFLKLIKRRHPDMAVVMLTGKSDSDTIIQTGLAP